MDKGYVVYIASGEYSDYYEDNQFFTTDGSMALNWVEKYNRIIEVNYERITSFYDNDDHDKKPPLYHDYIMWDKPTANFKVIKIR